MIDAQFGLIIWIGLLGIFSELIGLFVSSSLIRKIIYSFTVVLCSFVLAALLSYKLSIATVLVAIVIIFRIFNSFRVVYARMNQARLLSASRRTSIVLILIQLLVIFYWYIADEFSLALYHTLMIVTVSSAVWGMVLLLSTKRNLDKSRMRPSDKYIPDLDLPSVSVCIPARNETDQLSTCLESIVGSDYLKLEVLVLDDCSQDRTSEIIKGFARDGVRFIPGKPPAEGWLAKNQAYQALAEAASGEILIFCGVDVRFDKHTIKALVSSMVSRKKKMISVLPRGMADSANTRLLQPMRYWWELALPRRMFNRPPVLSTFWAISKSSFFRLGEMKSVRNSIIPEGYFARELTKTDEYSFMRSNGKLSVRSAKRMPDQWQTSIRTRYPRLRNRPENVLLITLAEFTLLISPILVLILALISSQWLLFWVAWLSVSISLYVHFLVIKAWGVDHAVLALVLFPTAVISEIIATLISMWRYEFAEVNWKDRNVCIPAMKNYPKLPKT